MKILKLFLALAFFSQTNLHAKAQETNVLIYGDNVQVNSYINNEYQNVRAGIPIQGTIMITHMANNQIDPASFQIGNLPLKTKFLQATEPSSYNELTISIYQFTLEGQTKGIHTFPPIKVKVGGKSYEAAPLTIEVAGDTSN